VSRRQVILQSVLLGKDFQADRTLVLEELSFDSHGVVAQLVQEQVPGVDERLGANHALEGFHPQVFVLVLFEADRVVKTLAASLAIVVKLVVVHPVYVGQDAGSSGSSVRTQRTTVLLVFVVLLHVTREVVRFAEPHRARIARVRFDVSLGDVTLGLFFVLEFGRASVADVHFQAGVELVSVLLLAVAFVGLFVFRESPPGGEIRHALLAGPRARAPICRCGFVIFVAVHLRMRGFVVLVAVSFWGFAFAGRSSGFGAGELRPKKKKYY
jgi:hypothetical protein